VITTIADTALFIAAVGTATTALAALIFIAMRF
jgi:hypothetical protein